MMLGCCLRLLCSGDEAEAVMLLLMQEAAVFSLFLRPHPRCLVLRGESWGAQFLM